MDLLRHIFAAIFYILFFIWLFLKIRNIIWVYRLECKESYKESKREIKKNKLSRYLFRISLCAAIFMFPAIIIGIIIIGVGFLMGFLYGLGAIYGDTINNLMQLTLYCAYILMFVPYIFYIIIYMLLVRGIYINYILFRDILI